MSMQCPNPACHSTRISYNRIPPHIIEKAQQCAQAGNVTRSPLMLFGGTAAYAAMEMINHLRAEWRCDACQARFNV